jgi:hypothetical protein
VILPTRHQSVAHTLLGLGALLLQELKRPETVSALWHRVRARAEVGSYQRFTLALDLLHLLGAVDLEDGLLTRSGR